MAKIKYEEYSLKLSDGQRNKILNAIKNKEGVTIRIKDNGDDKIALTQTQVNKINKAFQDGKSVNIKPSYTQLKYNQDKVEGGFSGALLAGLRTVGLPLLKRAAPTLAKTAGLAALTSGISEGIKRVFGNGLYLKRNNQVHKIKDMGSGVYLSHANEIKGEGLNNLGDGLYVYNKRDKNCVDGSGFISDITKHIPLLNLIF